MATEEAEGRRPAENEPADETSLRVRRALRGEPSSLEWLVDRFSPLLLVQARYRMQGPMRRHVDPHDLVQDVWLRALPRLGDFTSRGGRFTPALLAYLGTLLRNRARDLVSKHVAGKPVRLEGVASGSRTADDPLARTFDEMTGVVTRFARQEGSDRVLLSLEELDPQDREVVVLRAVEQRRNHEVAALLGEKPNTVAVRYKRALERLRALLPGSVFTELEAS